MYTIGFYERSDEEEAKHQQDVSEKNPDIPPDRIGAFQLDREFNGLISVPPHFLDVLWNAALAADGVLRSISLTVQPQKRGGWAVFEVTLSEAIADELPFDKGGRPKVISPRADPVVAELRALKLRPQWRSWVSGIAVIAAGVLVALWIAKLWR
jgi:hypothetical protein